MENQQQNQQKTNSASVEQNKPAVVAPEHNKPDVAKPGETPTQKPAGTEPKSNA